MFFTLGGGKYQQPFYGFTSIESQFNRKKRIKIIFFSIIIISVFYFTKAVRTIFTMSVRTLRLLLLAHQVNAA